MEEVNPGRQRPANDEFNNEFINEYLASGLLGDFSNAGQGYLRENSSTQRLVKITDHLDQLRERQTSYEDMSMVELGRILAEAETNNDRTTIINVSDVLIDKLIEHEAKHISDRPKTSTSHKNEQSDSIWNRIIRQNMAAPVSNSQENVVDDAQLPLFDDDVSEAESAIEGQYEEEYRGEERDNLQEEPVQEPQTEYIEPEAEIEVLDEDDEEQQEQPEPEQPEEEEVITPSEDDIVHPEEQLEPEPEPEQPEEEEVIDGVAEEEPVQEPQTEYIEPEAEIEVLDEDDEEQQEQPEPEQPEEEEVITPSEDDIVHPEEQLEPEPEPEQPEEEPTQEQNIPDQDEDEDDEPEIDNDQEELLRLIEQLDHDDDLAILRQDTQEALEEYAMLEAGRGRRSRIFLRGRRFSKESIELAKDTYLTRSEAQLERELELLEEVDENNVLDIVEIAAQLGLNASHQATNAIRQQRLIATGRYRWNSEHTDVELIQPRNKAQRAYREFTNWWSRQSGSGLFSARGLTKSAAKSTVLFGGGVVIGGAAAVAGSMILGPVLGAVSGGLLANRLSKAFLANRINKDANSVSHAVRLHNDLDGLLNITTTRNNLFSNNATRNAILNDRRILLNTASEQTNGLRRHNQARMLGSVLIAAAGGFVGHIITDKLGITGGAPHHVRGAGLPVKPYHQHTVGTYKTHKSANPSKHVAKKHKLGSTAIRIGGTNATNTAAVSNTETLSFSGDSIWHEVFRYLVRNHDNSSNSVVQKVTGAVLKEKGVTWPGAHFLPIGYKFSIPRYILEKV